MTASIVLPQVQGIEIALILVSVGTLDAERLVEWKQFLPRKATWSPEISSRQESTLQDVLLML